ncbi:[FeFe] hydrogenase H-cluster radical SAM maturase HydG [Haliovirga abyssi]|uniref:[FeFe] hydrogenase H-cluster radical SAM maturase HydG n=1 Tax=Haliovirga abyssi TaxID=2996794 RepID=A0AAU9DPY1_9FUSO|nr:[FeFe] hydrogenase H-cluster radical SAM maturase HydG [Haliovirga abyssi]BDU50518.1 [FeFe] hydrogenase H-cluster radical SAM maturase HydG [Haliovirga abyssi]
MNWQDEVKEDSFINEEIIENLLETHKKPTKEEFDKIIAKAHKHIRLELDEVAMLLNSSEQDRIDTIFKTAKEIKEEVYGHRVVLFAPLYIGNKCMNNCTYCGFKATNDTTIRKTLTLDELGEEVKALEDEGHKRLILVYGTHPDYTPEFMAETIRKVYETKSGKGEIRRVNINASPLDVEEFKVVKDAGIGTYQIFQESYHLETYKRVHPSGEKSKFKWRLFGLDRAMRAGIDDVGIGALFGLYDWKFEVMGLMQHVLHLEETFGVGPHTISFPRLNEANGAIKDPKYVVKDDDLKRIIAILRLAVPYTGLILTARETAELRKECMELGVSQIDAGTKIELQGYSKHKKEQDLRKEQFKIGDSRGLDEVMGELMTQGFIPSFCTACYRLGRTGEHFMEFSKPGFIHNFCTPNALLTLSEYLDDYASPETKKAGYSLVEKELKTINLGNAKDSILKKLESIKNGERDLYY